MKKTLLVFTTAIAAHFAMAQSFGVSLMNNTYQQSFDSTLAKADTVATPLPYAWEFYELGDAQYADGMYYTNNTFIAPGAYSLGDDPATAPSYATNLNQDDRAIGGRADQVYVPILRWGMKVKNTETDTAITSMQIAFKGETWFQDFGQVDTLVMYYSVDADSLGDTTSVTWTRVPSADYILENFYDGANGLNYNYAGNLTDNFEMVTGTATGMNVLPGQEFYIMWQPKFSVANKTNLGGIDDLSITFGFGAQAPPIDTDTTSIVIIQEREPLEASLYPTPAKEDVKIRITSSLENVSWYMTNAVGQRIKTGFIKAPGYGTTTQTVDVRDLPAGIYFVYLESDDDKIRTLRFIKE